MVLEGKERSRGHYTLILCRDISRQNLLCLSEILHKAEWKFKGQKLCADKMDALMPLPLSERLILAFHINGISHLSTFLQRYNNSRNVTILGCVPRMIVMGKLWRSSPGLGFSQEVIIWAMWTSDAAWSGFRENLWIISSATPIATSELTGPDIIEHFRLMAGAVNFLLLTLFVAFSELKFLRKQKNSQKSWYDRFCTSWFWYSCTGLLLFYDLLTVSQNSNSHFQEIWD